MTGNIPSAMVQGEDGRGKRLPPATAEDNRNLAGGGLASMPKVLAAKNDEWTQRESELRSAAEEQERAKLRELAQKEGKL